MRRSVAGAIAALVALAGCAGSDATSDDGDPGGAVSIPTVPATTAPATGATTTVGSGATSEPSPPATLTATTTAPVAPDLGAAALRLTPVAELDRAIAMAVRPSDPNLYVAEQDGSVWAVPTEGGEPQPALDLTDLTSADGERGLLGITFSPDGTRLYASYTNNDGDTRLDEYAVGADGTIDPTSRRAVFGTEQPYANHNGGHVVFGPDGFLYLGLGDGGSGGDPQRTALDLTTPLGKLLRIDPRPAGAAPYQVPSDNPFLGVAGARPEIFSIGLRNPWRFSFDAATGDLWVADVGQNQLEELNVVPAAEGAGRGANFGWSAFEASQRFNDDQPADGARPPLYEYPHGELGCSVTGGFVYRGQAVPALRGVYLFSDYCTGGVRAWAAGEVRTLLDEPSSVVSFGEGDDGEVYVLAAGTGVFRLDPA